MSDYIPKHSPHSTFRRRYQTFIRWQGTPDPAQMADAGLVYEGSYDIVKCFTCGIRLATWDISDNPFVRHAFINPDCSYILGKCGEIFVNNVLRQHTLVYNTQHPDYFTYHCLLQTFRSWTRLDTPRPVEFAESGFYYADDPYYDSVVCYYCGGTLQNLALHYQPMISHARFFPYCSWLHKRKGLDFIQMCQSEDVPIRSYFV